MTPPAPLPRESAKAFHAFQLYLTDPKRSRVSVGKKLGVSRQAIDKWADRFHWSERVKTAMIADTERAAKADELAKLNVAEERERERLKFQQRAVEASKRATERGLQILKQSAKGSKPSDAARLLAVGDMIGRAALELTPSGAGSFGLNPTITPVIKVVLRRDATSLRVKELEDKFLPSTQKFGDPKTDSKMQLDWPPIEQQFPEFRMLLREAALRGMTLDLLAAAFVARAQTTGALPTCKELLEEINAGTFDFLFFDHGQSLS